MTDLSGTISPKSDQLNSDDLIAGPRTIAITAVRANEDSAEQPISIFFDGDGGKPYKPCKSMRRVLVAVWGPDGSTFPGRSLTIYRDAGVTFGGLQVGGIRISHMSHIDRPVTLALTATRANRKPFTVKPLEVAPPPEDRAKAMADSLIQRADACEDSRALFALVDDAKAQEQRAWLKSKRPELSQDVEAAFMATDARIKVGAPAEAVPE
jgi:hypothetical protein